MEAVEEASKAAWGVLDRVAISHQRRRHAGNEISGPMYACKQLLGA
jgi:hypothetical protein